MSDDDNNVWWLTPFYHRQLLQGYGEWTGGEVGGMLGINGEGAAKDSSGREWELRREAYSSESES